MQDYSQMGKLKLNSKGFTAVEGLLVVLILVVMGAVGYMVYHNDHKNKTTPVASTTTTKTANNTPAKTSTAPNPYAGWKTYTLANEQLTFQYPSDWTLASYPSSTDGGGNKQDIDDVALSAPGVPSGSASLSIEDGTNTGGDYNLIYSNPVPVTYVGAKDYLVFAGAEHPGQAANSIGCGVLVTSLANDANGSPTFPADKNVTSVPSDSYMDILACNTLGTTYTTSTISQAASTPAFKDDILIIQSMHY